MHISINLLSVELDEKRQKIWDFASQSCLKASTHLITTRFGLVSLQFFSVLSLAPAAAEGNGKNIIALKSTGIINSLSGVSQHGYL